MQQLFFPFYAFVFFLSLMATAFFEKRWIPRLARAGGQPIYEGGPSWHMKKSGTPTMGGLAFLLTTLTVWALSIAFLWTSGSGEGALSLSITLGYAVLNALLGILDDVKKLHRRQNAGLSPKEKLIFQFLFAALFLAARALLLGDRTSLVFSVGTVELGVVYYPLALLLLVGIVNFANLTDGIDGLAASVTFGISVSLFYLGSMAHTEVAILAALMMGLCIGFLFFNLHPARVFMGDTGSLFLGALVAGGCCSLGNVSLAISVGAVFVLEGGSVILQVIAYKLFHRRIFRMAPLHHHLERLGWSENRICLAAILLTLICSVPAYLLYLPI